MFASFKKSLFHFNTLFSFGEQLLSTIAMNYRLCILTKRDWCSPSKKGNGNAIFTRPELPSSLVGTAVSPFSNPYG